MRHEAPTLPCPLCQSTGCVGFFRDRRRNYLRCPACLLVFVPSIEHLPEQAEKAEYDRHENNPEDPGYRRFLSRLFEPVAKRLAPIGHGLDFGSGPGPTLSVMFGEAGHTMQIYDPFFAPDTAVFEHSYDFITASEVVEHLSQPGMELQRLWSSLKPQGILGIMTKRVIDLEAFTHWHYKNDPTHICFFSTRTFEWLANQWCASLLVVGKDVVLFTKNS